VRKKDYHYKYLLELHETKKKHQDGMKHMITRYPLVINATVYLVSKSTLSIQGRFHYQPLSRNKAFKRRPSRGVREESSRLWSTDLFTVNLTYAAIRVYTLRTSNNGWLYFIEHVLRLPACHHMFITMVHLS